MRVVVDSDRCQGHARCVLILPEVFDSDDLGYAVVRDGGRVRAEDEAGVKRAAANCPERAIVVDG